MLPLRPARALRLCRAAAGWLWLLAFCLPPSLAAVPTPVPPPRPARRFLLAHYLPWFAASPLSPQWGWHWTMNHFHPERMADGQPEIASHFHPLIGPYDSGDLEALQCQVLLMKLAGIDGVVVDWYGTDDYLDYAAVNRNTRRLVPLLEQAGLRFVICYEDQSVAHEVAGGFLPASEALAHGQGVMQTMQRQFFSSPAYLTLGGRPVLLSFGAPYYTSAQWEQMFSILPRPPLYLTETVIRAGASAVGAFDWPLPQGGTAQALAEQSKFCADAGQWPLCAADAFPRFQDIYAQAGAGKSYGSVDDRNGQTYADTLERALQSQARIVQIATWNDWGEGTQIEPSAEFGCRDLQATLRLRRQFWGPGGGGTASDLALPIEWYGLYKKSRGDAAAHAKLAGFFALACTGRMTQARRLLARSGRVSPTQK